MLIALVVALSEAPASEAGWVRVGGNDKAADWVDAQNVRRVADEVQIIHQTRFATLQAAGWDRIAYTTLVSCKDRKAFILSMSHHSGDHELMSATFHRGKAAGEPASPGSSVGRAIAFACDGTVEK